MTGNPLLSNTGGCWLSCVEAGLERIQLSPWLSNTQSNWLSNTQSNWLSNTQSNWLSNTQSNWLSNTESN